jgi:serine/threonine protein kinase
MRTWPAQIETITGGVDTSSSRLETVVNGRYLLLDRIASGATARVYRAEDLLLGRDVALKVLHPWFSDDEESVARFRREAACAARVQHPHVVSVYDDGEWGDTHYIAMEYVDGPSLKSIIRDDGPLAPPRAIDLTLQLLSATACIHRRGIIHRDLKPANAIVDREGFLKLTDFGVARAEATDITRTGAIIGTARYLSPEQAQGRTLTVVSDLYSIGVILHELLTGRPLFDGENVVTVALKHINEQPAPPSTRRPTIPTELDAIVLRALAKDPRRRFPDADAFIDALERTEAGLPAVQDPECCLELR